MATLIELNRRIEIFLCYAHEDETYREQLEKRLMILKRHWSIVEWYDGKIMGGSDWEKEIDTNLNASQIILLLVSPDFMTSEYCYSIEMKQALERHNRGEARVIPIILRPVGWENAPFSKLQVLPKEGKPVTQWRDQDEAFADISKGIEKIIKGLFVSYTIEEGKTCFKEKHYEKALIAYDTAIELEPASALAFSYKGDALSALSRYREALSAYEQALRLEPDLENARNGQNTAIRQLDNLVDSQRRIETELKHTKQLLEQHVHLAEQLNNTLQATQQKLENQYNHTQRLEKDLSHAQRGLKDHQGLIQQLEDRQHQAQQFTNKLREISEGLQSLVVESQLQDVVLSVPETQRSHSSSPAQLSPNLPEQGKVANTVHSESSRTATMPSPDKSQQPPAKHHTGSSQIEGILYPISELMNLFIIGKKNGQTFTNRKAVVIGLIVLIIVNILFPFIYPAVATHNMEAGATATAVFFSNATATSEAPGIDAAAAYNTSTTNGISFGFDAKDTRWNPFERVIDSTNVAELKAYWTASTGAAITSSPIVYNGVVYVGSNDSRLYAFNASGCQDKGSHCDALWSSSVIGKATPSSPAVANGTVYVNSDTGWLDAFNASGCGSGKTDCSPLWSASLGSSTTSSPIVTNGVIYVVSRNRLSAYNTTQCASGSTNCSHSALWIAKGSYYDYYSDEGLASSSSPAVADGVVYVGGYDRNLYAFNVSGCGSGKNVCTPLWTSGYSKLTSPFSSPVVANHIVYISNQRTLYAFDTSQCGSGKTNCSYLWAASISSSITSSLAMANGIIYAGSNDGKLYAFDASGCGSGKTDCAPLWSSSVIGHSITSSPLVANGVVYIGSDDGKLYAFDASGCGNGKTDCSPLWSSPVIGHSITSSPTVANGVVYVGSDDGNLYSFYLSGSV